MFGENHCSLEQVAVPSLGVCPSAPRDLPSRASIWPLPRPVQDPLLSLTQLSSQSAFSTATHLGVADRQPGITSCLTTTRTTRTFLPLDRHEPDSQGKAIQNQKTSNCDVITLKNCSSCFCLLTHYLKAGAEFRGDGRSMGRQLHLLAPTG